MDHHDGGTRGIGRPEFDDVQPRAGDVDHPALRRIVTLQHYHASLRDQRQNHQRRDATGQYHGDDPEGFVHGASYDPDAAGFRAP